MATRRMWPCALSGTGTHRHTVNAMRFDLIFMLSRVVWKQSSKHPSRTDSLSRVPVRERDGAAAAAALPQARQIAPTNGIARSDGWG